MPINADINWLYFKQKCSLLSGCAADRSSGITVVLSPAVIMDLKQDFWSMRGQMMYWALGLLWRSVRKHRVKLIPVAMGTTKQLVTLRTPGIQKKLSIIIFYTLETMSLNFKNND